MYVELFGAKSAEDGRICECWLLKKCQCGLVESAVNLTLLRTNIVVYGKQKSECDVRVKVNTLNK
jgi:hypothetical protein